jgi:hypothetical protein
LLLTTPQRLLVNQHYSKTSAGIGDYHRTDFIILVKLQLVYRKSQMLKLFSFLPNSKTTGVGVFGFQLGTPAIAPVDTNVVHELLPNH